MSITLDPGDTKVSCLNISDNQLPTSFLAWLENDEPYEYMDTGDLREHMYSIDMLKEEPGYRDEFDEVIDEIGNLMAKHDCAYFRIITI